MAGLRILITGASIAGPTCAYWLARAGAQVTVVERAPSLRLAGQNVDVRGAGLKVIRQMGLEETIRSHTTKEEGLVIVNSKGKHIGEFPVGDGNGFSSDVEILRGTLSQIIYDATKKNTDYVFGDYVEEVEQLDHSIRVKFANSGVTKDFDLLVIADGMTSKTRGIVFGQEESRSAVRSLGQNAAYFAIPSTETDGTWAKWYNAPGGRCVLLRPDNAGSTRAFLGIMRDDEKVRNALRIDTKGQKALVRELFADAGWEIGRVLEGMDNSDDFYMQQVGQVKMDKWSSGRATLVGDAGYCPSLITGMGTSTAIVGSYVLACEIAKNPTDIKAAQGKYEEIMRPFVNKVQHIGPGAPGIVNPQTRLGISILNTIVRFVSWSGISNLLGNNNSGPPPDGIDLPQCEF